MWRTIGNKKALDFLRRGLAAGRTSHAYLIAGPRQIGKMTLAMDLASALECIGDDKPCGQCEQCSRTERGLHTDVRVVGLDESGSRTRALISIDQVREMQREASLKPYEGAYRVFIFDEAERLSEEAANCLLKTLEEPPDQVVLVLLAVGARSLLPTLVSRCQVIEMRPVARPVIAAELSKKHGVDASTADELARLSAGRPGWAVEAARNPELVETRSQDLDTVGEVVNDGLEKRFAYASSLATSFTRSRETGRRSLDIWLDWWRDVMLVREGAPDLVTNFSKIDVLKSVAGRLTREQVVRSVDAVHEAMENLERNVNPRLALEHMMLTLPTLRHSSGQALRHSSGQALRHSSGQALRHSSGQALRHSSGQALRHSSGQALRHSSGQALRHSSGQALRHSSGQALRQGSG